MSKFYNVILPGVEITNHEGKKIRQAVGCSVEIKLRTEEKHYLAIGAIEDPNAPAKPSMPAPKNQTAPIVNADTEEDAVWSVDPVSVEAVHLAEKLEITVEDVEEKILKLVDLKGLTPVLAIRELYGELETEALPEGDADPEPAPTGPLAKGDAVTAMFEDELREGVIHSIRKNGVVCVTLEGDEKEFREFDKSLVERRTEG